MSEPPNTGDRAWLLVPSFLFGPETWRPVADLLTAQGETVLVADPAPAKVRDGSWVVAWAEDVIDSVPLGGTGSIVVVGHAASCPRIPLVARRLIDRGCSVAGIILVNGRFPADGRSPVEEDENLSDLLDGLVRPDDYLPPWQKWWGSLVTDMLPDEEARTRVFSEARCVPRAIFSESIPAPALPADVGHGYLTMGEMYRPSHERALSEGWVVGEIPGEHLQMVVDPDIFVGELERIVAEF